MENGRVQKTSSGTREEGGRWGGVGFAIRKSHNKRKSSAFDDRSVSQCFFLCFLLFFLFQLSSRSRTCFFLLCCAYQEAAKWWPIVGEFGIGIGDRDPFLPQVVPNSYP